MLTTDQVAIVLLAAVGAAGIVAGYLAVTDRATGGRHVTDPDVPRTERIPPAPLEVRRPQARARHARETVTTPGPRPYTGGIPVLVVDGPPGGGHGVLPAPGLPIVREHRCSYCRDGQVLAAVLGAGCPWCGCRTAVRS